MFNDPRILVQLRLRSALKPPIPRFACLACLAPSVPRDHRTHAKARNESNAKAKEEQKRLIHVRPLERPEVNDQEPVVGWHRLLLRSHSQRPENFSKRLRLRISQHLDPA